MKQGKYIKNRYRRAFSRREKIRNKKGAVVGHTRVWDPCRPPLKTWAKVELPEHANRWLGNKRGVQ